MEKMVKFALAIVITVLLGLAPALIVHASSPARAQKSTLNTAEKWAEAVVEVLTDPKLYRYNEQSLPVRLHNLVRLAPLPPPVDGVMKGSNPSEGILMATVNFIGDGVQEVRFLMAARDAQGHPVFPAVRRRLEKGLQAPLWVEYKDEDIPERSRLFWRRGNTKYVMSLSLVLGPNSDSAVSVVASVEQGDPEE